MNPATAYPIYWITPQLATGPAPMSYDHLESLKSEGIGAIMNLCAEYCDLHSIESDSGFEVYYLPVADEEAPQLKALEDALAWLDEAIYLGKKVYVHCRHGIGRTGTVISAYLLRRGLGSKLVKQKIKNMRSRPANFNQWWFIRKFSKKEPPLTIREPSLEWKQAVELTPFFADYRQLLETVDRKLEEQGSENGFCGSGHVECCKNYVEVSLIEAAYLTHFINRKLTSRKRLGAMERSLEISRTLRNQGIIPDKMQKPDLTSLYEKENILCPLSLEQKCLVYASRPLDCRFSDLKEKNLYSKTVNACRHSAQELSRELYLALSGSFLEAADISFPLVDVVSGKFVQSFFHILAREAGIDRSRNSKAKPGGG